MDVPPGTEFMSDYNIDSNLRALLAYGFVMEDPLKDVVTVVFEDPSRSMPLTAPLSFLASSRAPVMSALRKLVADPSELELLENNTGVAPVTSVIRMEPDAHVGAIDRKKQWVSISLEKKMLLRLAKACKFHLDEYVLFVSVHKHITWLTTLQRYTQCKY